MRLSQVTDNPIMRALRMEVALVGDSAPLEKVLRPFARPQFLVEAS